MEKNEMPIIGASAAAPIQALVPASDVAAAPVQAPRRLERVRTGAVRRAGEPLRHQHRRRRAGGNPLFLSHFNTVVLDLALLGFVCSHFNPFVLDLALLGLVPCHFNHLVLDLALLVFVICFCLRFG